MNDNDKYEFKITQFDGTEISIKGNKANIDEIIDDFVSLLRAATFGEQVLAKRFPESSILF